jgi:ribonuclease HII
MTPKEEFDAKWPKPIKRPKVPLPEYKYDISLNRGYECGIDEAGRGPMFGRVYVAGVVLPRDDPNFNYHLLKDSKKFTSRKKLTEAAQYIRDHAITYSVQYMTETEIDTYNIRSATIQCMHKVARDVMERGIGGGTTPLTNQNTLLLVDGNDFKPLIWVGDGAMSHLTHVPHETVVSGDATFGSIAAASILAKSARDDWIDEMCDSYPILDLLYGLRTNKGYGTKPHIDGIRKFGISQWHRRTFGICKVSKLRDMVGNDEM